MTYGRTAISLRSRLMRRRKEGQRGARQRPRRVRVAPPPHPIDSTLTPGMGEVGVAVETSQLHTTY